MLFLAVPSQPSSRGVMTLYEAAFFGVAKRSQADCAQCAALGFGLLRHSAGLGRMGDVIGGVAASELFAFSVWMMVPRSCHFMAGWVHDYMTCLKLGTCAAQTAP